MLMISRNYYNSFGNNKIYVHLKNIEIVFLDNFKLIFSFMQKTLNLKFVQFKPI